MTAVYAPPQPETLVLQPSQRNAATVAAMLASGASREHYQERAKRDAALIQRLRVLLAGVIEAYDADAGQPGNDETAQLLAAARLATGGVV